MRKNSLCGNAAGPENQGVQRRSPFSSAGPGGGGWPAAGKTEPPPSYVPLPFEPSSAKVVGDRTVIFHHPFAAVLPETPLMPTVSPSERPCGIPVAISIGEAFVAPRIENHCGSGRLSVAAPLVKEEFASLLK